MTNLRIQGKKYVSGCITVPGDKSISHRCAILGSIAKGVTTVEGFLKSQDTVNTLEAFAAMGVEWRWEDERLIIEGHGRNGLREPKKRIDLGNSGTSIRLLTGLVAGLEHTTVFTGDESLRRRPMGRVVAPLRLMGADIEGRDKGNLAPLTIRGRRLKGLRYELPVASAQVKSALLLAGLWADGVIELQEPGPARNHTEIMLGGFGAPVEILDDGWLRLAEGAGDALVGRDIAVPGDFSSAAFFIVAALITPGSGVTLRKVGINPTRTGALDILEKMGASIELSNLGKSGGEPYGDIVAGYSELEGTEIRGDEVVKAIDEFPVLAVAAAYANGRTVIRDAAELRVKESDRISTMAGELTKMGVATRETGDGMIIEGGRALKGAEVTSHGDHRVAMALTVAALGAEGETVVHNSDCVATSFPSFERLLKKVLQG